MSLQPLLLAIALAVTTLVLAAYVYALRARLSGLDAQRQALRHSEPAEHER